MPTTIQQGITGSTSGGDFTDELKVTKNTNIITRAGSDGVTKWVKDLDPTADIALTGGGNPAIALGSGGVAVTGIADGAVIVSKYEHTENNTETDDFSADAKHFPGATYGGGGA